MNPNPMNYLFAAYAAVWIILAIYLYSIHSREKKLRQEIDRLKRLLAGK
ncbi:MAG: CcmD family protein [Acidobacteria bacterium]|nr:CcmD family protein [Acidobacteriota bacterium]